MAIKLQLGKTQEEIEREEYEAQLLREREIEQLNKEREERLFRYNKKLKRNKLIIILSFSFIVLFTVILSAINIFTRKETDMNQIISEVSSYQRFNFFNQSGVDNYLKKHIDKLFKPVLTISDANIEKFEILSEETVVKRILKHTDNFSGIYFNTQVKISYRAETITKPDKSTEINKPADKIDLYELYLPLYYDTKLGKYAPAGDIIVQNIYADIDTDIIEESFPYFTFDEEPINTEQVAVFLTNFLTMLYDGKDVSAMIGDENVLLNSDILANYEFVKVNSAELYATPNLYGYNTICNYTVKSDSGLLLTYTDYFLLEDLGNGNYIINKLFYY